MTSEITAGWVTGTPFTIACLQREEFLNWLMDCLLPRDEIKKIRISESILGGCAHFIVDVVIDNQTDVFVLVASNIVWFPNRQTVEKNWILEKHLLFHLNRWKLPENGIRVSSQHHSNHCSVSFTNAISNIVKSPSRTISETSDTDSLLTTEINCVACDVGLFNYCRRNCRLHCRLWLLLVASTIVTVIIACRILTTLSL